MTILLMLATLTTAASMTWLMINPLTMGLTILIMSMSVALLFAMTLSSWMAFLVFLIYIGGMMVMFAYFVATSPNMPMNMFWPIMFSMSTFSILMITMLSSSTKLTTSTPSMALNTFYSPQLMETLLILALILLLTMVIVVKLVSLNKGPLRPFN